ncbi:MAG: ABC transporter permease [Candidatus Paceibacterota bacterium]|jgi:putative ABC transport system permease protein
MDQIKEYFSLAVRNIRTRSLRSWLTVLGIIIGVFLIVSLLSLSEGLKTTINKQLQALGGEMVMVMPGGEADLMTSMMFGGSKLQREDIEAIQDAPGVDTVSVMSYTGITVRYENESKQVAISGLGPWKESVDLFSNFYGWQLKEGRWPSKGNHIVVGSYAASDLFSKEIKTGSEITVKGKKLVVSGILNSVGNQQDDSMIYMDMDTYQDITGEQKGTAAYAMVKLEEGAIENVVAAEIEDALDETRKRRSGTDDQDFSVITSEKMGEIAGTILGIIQMVIIGFASIAILVGGIGITNSMFTSVRERTREIGIMKAIGATNSAILSIFLIEAGIIGILGGLGGTILGTGLAKLVDTIGKMNPSFYLTTTVAPWMIIFALVFSFVIGCLAGYFPAKQAAKLKPVEALRRYE